MCDELVKLYFDFQVPCGFQIKDRIGRYHGCSLRRKTHGDVHMHVDGSRVISYKGEFESNFNPSEFAWSNRVLEAVESFEARMPKHDRKANRHGWIEGHRNCVRRFYTDIGGANVYTSNRVCVCCLSNPPEHHLLCAHIICNTCATDFGHVDESGQILIQECPVCDGSDNALGVTIRQPPPFSGRRVLVLDG